MAIARDYRIGRVLERDRTSRPDARRTMEVLAAAARALHRTASHLSLSLRIAVFRAMEDSAALLGREGISPPEVGQILEELAEGPGISTEEAHGPDMELVPCLEILSGQLLNLPNDCEWPFYELQQYAPLFDSDWPPTEAIEKFAERIAVFVEIAAKLMKGDRGPRNSHVQMRTVEALKCEFKRAGKIASHSATSDGDYAGRPVSEFGKFVEAFFQAVEPDPLLRQGIRDALENACWSSRKLRQQARMEQSQRNRRNLIEAEFARAGVTIFPFSD